MKKLILLVAFLLFISVVAVCQAGYPSVITPTKTTITGVDTSRIATPAIRSYSPSFVIATTVTKTAGTLAGSAAFQGSLDGTVFFTIATTALTDGSNVLFFREANGASFAYYRIMVTSSTGTASVTNSKYTKK